MSAFLSKGLARISLGTLENTQNGTPNDIQYIRSLNYGELEEKYQIRKYYPQFIHNFEYSTPQIKAMICLKPIYANANRQNRKEEVAKVHEFTADGESPQKISIGQKEARESSRKSRKDMKHERAHEHRAHKKEYRELRKNNHEERKCLKEQHRKERREERETSRVLLKQHLGACEEGALKAYPTIPVYQPQTVPQSKEIGSYAGAAQNPVFKNPFDSAQSTLVAAVSDSSMPPGITRGSCDEPKHRAKKASISERLRQLVLSKRPKRKHDIGLQKRGSFDQTKSSMTQKRDVSNNLLRIAETRGRGMSEVPQTTWDALEMWSDLQIAPFGSIKCGVWGKLAVATQKARE
ncbi:hypothetical protein HF325_004304 [Metschnikowia pulcherrima]|uniref:Uncharacterized protein n=1 Tax=Metschnikowia pulcherrima TaxID=27326 RepID=A0A8H7GR35_9ASCO|nr:hypothetical protein HF325_004304 [Metschnikowia pulcherrima]